MHSCARIGNSCMFPQNDNTWGTVDVEWRKEQHIIYFKGSRGKSVTPCNNNPSDSLRVKKKKNIRRVGWGREKILIAPSYSQSVGRRITVLVRITERDFLGLQLWPTIRRTAWLHSLTALRSFTASHPASPNVNRNSNSLPPGPDPITIKIDQWPR